MREQRSAGETSSKTSPGQHMYVGIDLHRRRSVIVPNNADGGVSSKTAAVPFVATSTVM